MERSCWSRWLLLLVVLNKTKERNETSSSELSTKRRPERQARATAIVKDIKIMRRIREEEIAFM